jgi:hypothetical protein
MYFWEVMLQKKGMSRSRKLYPSDVSDDEWSLAAAYMTLMREDADQREHPLRELFNGLRYTNGFDF